MKSNKVNNREVLGLDNASRRCIIAELLISFRKLRGLVRYLGQHASMDRYTMQNTQENAYHADCRSANVRSISQYPLSNSFQRGSRAVTATR